MWAGGAAGWADGDACGVTWAEACGWQVAKASAISRTGRLTTDSTVEPVKRLRSETRPRLAPLIRRWRAEPRPCPRMGFRPTDASATRGRRHQERTAPRVRVDRRATERRSRRAAPACAAC